MEGREAPRVQKGSERFIRFRGEGGRGLWPRGLEPPDGGRLCRRGAGKEFRRFRGFKGWWIALRAMLIKSALKSLPFRLHLSSGVGQPTIGRPFYGQAKSLLRLTWRPSAGSPQQRRISVKPIVSKLLLNTSRREFGVPQGFAQLLSEKGACVTCFPSPPHRHSDPGRRISVSIANDFYQLTIPLGKR